MNRRLALAAGAVVGFLAGVIVVSAVRTGTETDAGTEDTTPPADMVSVTVPATTTAPVAVSCSRRLGRSVTTGQLTGRLVPVRRDRASATVEPIPIR